MKWILPLALLAAACASTVAEDQATWFGATPEEVRAAWGPPARTEKLPDGAEVQTWVNVSPASSGATVGVGFGVFRGGSSGGIGVGTGVSVPVDAGPPASLRCERRLTFRDGRAFDVEFFGEPPRACSGYQRPGRPAG
jgi:hypothetical protein